MQRAWALLALVLVAPALAGCTGPAGESQASAPEGRGSTAEGDLGLPSPPALEGSDIDVVAENVFVPLGASPPEAGPADPPAPAAQPAAPPEAAAPEPAGESPAENATEAEAGPAVPVDDGVLRGAAPPKLHAGDRWSYRGVDLRGAPRAEQQVVVGEASPGGVAAYVVNATVNGATTASFLTVEALNPVNETGYITELLRFPLEDGKAWTFGWERTSRAGANNTNWTANLRQSLNATVQVLGRETVHTPAGSAETFHLRANLTTTAGKLTRWMVLDYWYAPSVKNLARLETATEDGQRSWSELASLFVL
jgi:hypothetical protein